MKIVMTNCDLKYEIEGVCRLFFPNGKFEFHTVRKFDLFCDCFINLNVENCQNSDIIVNVSVNLEGKSHKISDKIPTQNLQKYDLEIKVSSLIFGILSQITGMSPDWGIITGVRPVKLFRSLLGEHGIEYAVKYFKEKLCVNDNKIRLMARVCEQEQGILELSIPTSFSLYVSIPFCPSRCSYCSFVSQSVEKSKKLIPEYVSLLVRELKHTAKLVSALKLNLETVYIGGGTPTVLSSVQLETIIDAIGQNFNLDTCREFTIEAGRPDTIDGDKLKVMKNVKNLRISINPQTFNDNVLNNIGRKHTALDTVKAFELAKKFSILNINMDLIAGLPTDTYESFVNSIQKAIQLSPKSITLHTLAIKRASHISQKEAYQTYNNKISERMVRSAYEEFCKSGYEPYYLYRQSKMVSGTENTGWAKDNFKGLYNIFIMDEIHSIIACGAGAVTKLKNPFASEIERIFNFKFAYEYISRFEEIIYRKEKVVKFYEKLL